jgi:RNA polymerase sigma-70 factor (ECF subfamily)
VVSERWENVGLVVKGFASRVRLQAEDSNVGSANRMTRTPSFENVVAAHGAMIQRIAAAHEADPSLREDLVQDILYALWRALPGFRDEAPLRAFVARVAANRSVTHVQRAIRDRVSSDWPHEMPVPEPNPEAQAIAAGERALLVGATRALPMSFREPALLAMEGFTLAEIADVLGITPNAVAIRMSRAKVALRRMMGGHDGNS